MAPKKAKSKLKKVLSPPQPPLPQEDLVDDDALMDDLLAQLDSKDEVVREETATVLQEMQVNKVAEELSSAPKKDSKARFKARQVRPPLASPEYVVSTRESGEEGSCAC